MLGGAGEWCSPSWHGVNTWTFLTCRGFWTQPGFYWNSSVLLFDFKSIHLIFLAPFLHNWNMTGTWLGGWSFLKELQSLLIANNSLNVWSKLLETYSLHISSLTPCLNKSAMLWICRAALSFPSARVSVALIFLTCNSAVTQLHFTLQMSSNQVLLKGQHLIGCLTCGRDYSRVFPAECTKVCCESSHVIKAAA